MKKLFLCLLLGVSLLKAECDVLGLKLNRTSAKELASKYVVLAVEKDSGAIQYKLEPRQFKINEINEIEIGFNDNGLLEYVSLQLLASPGEYKRVKEILDKKYISLEEEGDEITTGGWFSEKKVLSSWIFYRTKDMKDCEVSILYRPKEFKLEVNYLHVPYPQFLYPLEKAL
ncbi:hypothetical protein B6S12_05060 [Helicobacter valdiviensis]|uniref:Uncharacterized protein n=1 Tax=Helicobacter valdiviensis TaxID=1458358 RepID=A0A2W6MW50_9HELI|nr:hypothetical protein [Helicobacter valdiviensis]PZT48191.1 hypothetical protein B6S12_05060 [Helicobacter valdiviensis]